MIAIHGEYNIYGAPCLYRIVCPDLRICSQAQFKWWSLDHRWAVMMPSERAILACGAHKQEALQCTGNMSEATLRVGI